MSIPETVQRIQGPLTTRVIIEPGPIATASSELRVSAAAPDPFRLHYRKVPHDLFYYFSIFFLSLFLSDECTRTHNTPIIHGCGTETETHLRPTGCVSLFISSWLIIIPSSTYIHILRRQWFSNDVKLTIKLDKKNYKILGISLIYNDHQLLRKQYYAYFNYP